MVTGFNESEVLEKIAMKCIRNKQEEITKNLELQLAPYPEEKRTLRLILKILRGYIPLNYENMNIDEIEEEIGKDAVRIYCEDEISDFITLNPSLFNKRSLEDILDKKIRPEIYRKIGDNVLHNIWNIINYETITNYYLLENIVDRCGEEKWKEIAKNLEPLLAPYPKKERTISLLLEIIKGYKSPDYETMKLDKVKEEIGRYAVRIYCKDEIPCGLIKLLSEYYDSDLFDKKIDEQTYEQTLNKIRPEIYIFIGDRILSYLFMHVLNPENVHRYVMREHESQNSYNYE
ncbi:MAG: hypothetical protein RXQ77_03985 [Candidatus Nanopusillus sp.]